MTRVGLLHPGEMGASFGAALAGKGIEVSWVSAGRGEATRRRAEAAELREVVTLGELVSTNEVILSICPPHAARDVAESIGAYDGLYVDANAIAPSHSREIAALITSRGGQFVDGGIVGGPDSPTVYLAGERAGVIGELFRDTHVSAVVLTGALGAASALKIAYGAWTKGSSAMLLAIRAFARAEQVEEELLGAWSSSQGDLALRSERAGQQAITKGWRWVGEMEEIAASFAAVGLPSGFHEAAAAIFDRSPRVESASVSKETLDTVLHELGS